jgi:hypothetical protein
MPEYQQKFVSEWMKVLSERESLTQAFIPWRGDIKSWEIRRRVKVSFMRFMSEPSRKKLKAFLELAKGYWEHDMRDFKGTAKSSLVRHARENPPTVLQATIIQSILRENGIMVGFLNGGVFHADIFASAKLTSKSIPNAYMFDAKTVKFYKEARKPLPPGWAKDDVFFVSAHQRQGTQSTVQHEAQHVFDLSAGIEFDNLEYPAYLAEFSFALDLAIDLALDLLNCNAYTEPHMSALLQIRREMVEHGGAKMNSNGITPNENMRSVARMLLNKAYFEKTGFTYDDLIGIVRNQNID